MATPRAFSENLLKEVGIQIDGPNPWDITVHDERAFGRVFREGTLGMGEAYVDGWWDAPALDDFFTRVSAANLDWKLITPAFLWQVFLARFSNRQSSARAAQVAHAHYDLGNDLYEAMLDTRMIYTCAYWSAKSKPKTLDEAQEAKLDLICRKLHLKEGDRVLDIGCGWGGFAEYAARQYGVQVVGVTVSKEQLVLAKKRCEGLPVEFRLQDYREIDEQFDHIVSIEMIEAVGYKNLDEYFKVVARCLKDEGLFLLQVIGNHISVQANEPWIDKYIFPNGMLPSLAQMAKAIEKKLMIEDLHDFGADYDRTLVEWFKNFDAAWPTLKEKYGDRFYRIWKYYLLSCAGFFRSRSLSDWQIVFSKKGVPGGYESVR